jgi:carbonic anhydrase
MADSEDDVLSRMMSNNRAWAAMVHQDNPGFFEKLAKQQTPRVLWIGCSDSRVPGNESIGVMPGEVFFHRNVANQMLFVDFNSLAVLQYAVDWLRVRHIVVCGHYGCGGVKTALKQHEFGLLTNWLHGVVQTSLTYKEELDAIKDRKRRIDALCEINVIEQVRHVAGSSIVQQAWRRGQEVSVHGWIYGLEDGLLRDLGVTVTEPEELDEKVKTALAAPRAVKAPG